MPTRIRYRMLLSEGHPALPLSEPSVCSNCSDYFSSVTQLVLQTDRRRIPRSGCPFGVFRPSMRRFDRPTACQTQALQNSLSSGGLAQGPSIQKRAPPKSELPTYLAEHASPCVASSAAWLSGCTKYYFVRCVCTQYQCRRAHVTDTHSAE